MDVNRGLSSAAMDHPWTAYLKVSCDGNESQAQSPLSPSVNLIRAALLHVAATSRKKKDVSFGVLDCAKQLPSKKTTIQRLKLNQYVNGPLMFFSGYGRDIKQLPEKLLRNEYSLQKQLTAETAIHAAKVRDTEGLIKKCLKKTPCALLLAGGDLDPGAVKTLNAASDATKTISWVYLDASKVKFGGSGDRYSEKDLNLRKFMPGEHRLLMLGTYTGPMEADDEEEPGPMLFAKPYYGSFLEEPVTEFAVSYSQDSQEDESEPFSIRLLDLAKRRPPQVPRQSGECEHLRVSAMDPRQAHHLHRSISLEQHPRQGQPRRRVRTLRRLFCQQHKSKKTKKRRKPDGWSVKLRGEHRWMPKQRTSSKRTTTMTTKTKARMAGMMTKTTKMKMRLTWTKRRLFSVFYDDVQVAGSQPFEKSARRYFKVPFLRG